MRHLVMTCALLCVTVQGTVSAETYRLRGRTSSGQFQGTLGLRALPGSDPFSNEEHAELTLSIQHESGLDQQETHTGRRHGQRFVFPLGGGIVSAFGEPHGHGDPGQAQIVVELSPDETSCSYRAFRHQLVATGFGLMSLGDLDLQLESSSWSERREAVREVGRSFPSLAGTAALLRRAADEDADVREAALAELANRDLSAEDPAALGLLAEEARRQAGSDWRVRRDLIQALGLIPGAGPALIRALDHSDSDVLKAAVAALAGRTLDWRTATEEGELLEAVRALLTSSHWRARRIAATAAGRIPGDGAGAVLIQAMTDTDSDVRTEARAAFTRQREEFSDRHGHASLESLAVAFGTTSSGTERRDLVKRVEQLRGHRATHVLIQVLDDEDSDVRQAAAQALGRRDLENAPPQAKRAFVQAARVVLESSEWRARLESVRVLARIGTPQARVLLERASSDSDADVRREAELFLNGI